MGCSASAHRPLAASLWDNYVAQIRSLLPSRFLWAVWAIVTKCSPICSFLSQSHSLILLLRDTLTGILSGAREIHPLLGGWPCNSGSFCPSGCQLCRVTWWPLYITPLFTPLSIFLWFQRNKSLHGSKVVCLPQSSKSINLGFSICVSRRKTEHQSQSFFKPWEKHKDEECFWIRILGQNPPHLFQSDQSLNE